MHCAVAPLAIVLPPDEPEIERDKLCCYFARLPVPFRKCETSERDGSRRISGRGEGRCLRSWLHLVSRGCGM